MRLALGVVLAGLVGVPTDFQLPPIFNPGAPGAGSRVITAREAVDLSRTGFIEADVRFMQHMILHHAQAVEMVGLMRTRAFDETIRQLGERIASSQTAEIELMREWLLNRGQPTENADPHADHQGHADHRAGANQTGAADVAVMPGMLSQARMAALAAATGPIFDRLFLEGMIQHHQGALDMVDALNAEPEAAEDPLLSDFATSVVADQSAEILRMQSILSQP